MMEGGGENVRSDQGLLRYETGFVKRVPPREADADDLQVVGAAGTELSHPDEGQTPLLGHYEDSISGSTSTKRKMSEVDPLEDESVGDQQTEDPILARDGQRAINRHVHAGKRRAPMELAVSILDPIPMTLAQLSTRILEMRREFQSRYSEITEEIVRTKIVLSTVNQILTGDLSQTNK